MEISVKKRSILQWPLGITLIALAAAILWVAYPGQGAPLAIIAVGVLFIIGLREPIWAVAAVVLAQLSIPGYYIGPISLRLLLLLVIGILLWRAHIKEKIQLGKKAKQLILPVILLIAIIAISDLFNSSFDFAFKEFRYIFTGLLIVIFLPAVIKNIRDLKLLCGVAFFGMTMSVIIALYQGLVHSVRASGISEGTLQLSYLLGVVFLALLGILIVEGRKRENLRLIIPALLMQPALYLTYTRSALLALFSGLVALFIFLKTRIRGEIILLAILGLAIYFSASGIVDSYSFSARSEENQQESSLARKMLWQTGIAIALDNPVLGIGGDKYTDVAMEYASAMDPSLQEDRYFAYQILGQGLYQIHNDFLRMWTYYGTIALVAFLWILLVIMRNFIESFRTSRRKFIKGLSVGLAAGLVAYSINAFYHNVHADFSLVWIIAGFSLAVIKLADQEHNVF